LGRVGVCRHHEPRFGDGLVVFVGIADPVKTPLIGLPKQP
jgi:hypothetical protein